MKLTSKLLWKKKAVTLIPFFLAAVAIWYLGPRLPIAHHFPLKDAQKRLILILTLFTVWLIKFLFLDPIKAVPQDSFNITKMLHALRGRFLGATRFLKKTIIDKHGFSTPLNKLPWYLLIGPPGAGKTTLLADSHINFILSKQYKQEGHEKTIGASSVCDWWVTRDLVLVDVPGCYTFSPPQDPMAETVKQNDDTSKTTASKPHAHLILWKNLLHLLTKHRQKNNIGAIIVALHLPELIKLSRHQQTRWFQEMKQRLTECWGKFGKLPVYFIITKCDLLPGFSEFFNDIGSDELVQPWGVPLSARKEHEKLLDVFTQRFNALIKRLNKQLIWRLHQERNALSRPLIKDFPLQLEYLKETLSHLIKVLIAANPDLDLEGIYLTSAAQANTSASANTLFHHDVPSSLEILPPSPFVSRSYFVKHIISYLLPHTSHHVIQRFRQKNTGLSQAMYAMGFGALVISALWLGKDFQRGLTQVATIQHYLTQYELYLQQNSDSQNTSASSAIPLLNTLQAASQSGLRPSRLQQIQTFYSKKSQQTALSIYHQALQTIIFPQISGEFEKYLQAASEKNPEQLYVTLKAYLLLKQFDIKPSSSRTDFIIQALEQISPAFSRKSSNKEFLQHVNRALQIKTGSALNNKLIKQSRKILNNLSSEELAYILLKNRGHNNAESDINLGTNIGTPPALMSKGTATQIPYMFTAVAFPTITKEEIPVAAQEAITGNMVLGKKQVSPDSLIPENKLISSLTQQLEKSYISHYIDIWESLVDNISLNLPKSVTETDAMILNLISHHSPLLQLLQTIHTNTNLNPILSSSLKLQALNTLYNQTQTQQKDSLYQIFVDLHELHVLLQHTSAATGIKKSSLEEDIQNAATASLREKESQQDPITRIRRMAEGYPDPIRNWLQTLVSYTQNYIQQDTKMNAAVKMAAAEPKPLIIPTPVSVPTSGPVLIPIEKIIAAPAPVPTLSLQPRQVKPLISRKREINLPKKEPLITQAKKPVMPKVKAPLVVEKHQGMDMASIEQQVQVSFARKKPYHEQHLHEGEYVQVLTTKNQPLIFVQKD